MAVKFLSLIKPVHFVSCVKRKGASASGRRAPPHGPRGSRACLLSLQFFLFILIIFLAELSAAILAFIFRENVRPGPRAPAPLRGPTTPATLFLQEFFQRAESEGP